MFLVSCISSFNIEGRVQTRADVYTDDPNQSFQSTNFKMAYIWITTDLINFKILLIAINHFIIIIQNSFEVLLKIAKKNDEES